MGLQRYYRSQRSLPTVHARLEFDLRTILSKPPDASHVKSEPAWLDAAYAALQNRRPNFQIAVGLAMPFRTCQAVRKREALELVAGSWIGCKPLLDALIQG